MSLARSSSSLCRLLLDFCFPSLFLMFTWIELHCIALHYQAFWASIESIDYRWDCTYIIYPWIYNVYSSLM